MRTIIAVVLTCCSVAAAVAEDAVVGSADATATTGQPGPNDPSLTAGNCANKTPKAPPPSPPPGGPSTPSDDERGDEDGGGQSGSQCVACGDPAGTSSVTGSGRVDSTYAGLNASLVGGVGGTEKTCQPTVHDVQQDTGVGANPAGDLWGGPTADALPAASGGGGCASCGGSGGFPGLLPGPLQQPTLGVPRLYRHLYTKDSQGLQSFGDQAMNWDLAVTTTWNAGAGVALFSFAPPGASIPLDFATSDAATFTPAPHFDRSVAASCVRVGDDLVITSEFGDRFTAAIPPGLDLTAPHRLPCRAMTARTGATFTLSYDDGVHLSSVQGPLGRLTIAWTMFGVDRVVGSVVGADGRTTRYEYADLSGSPSLHRVVHPDGSEDTYTYDFTPVTLANYAPVNHRLFVHRSNYVRDRSRDLVYYLEPRLGLAVLVEDALGRDVFNRLVNGVADGQVWRYVYDDRGRARIFWYDAEATLARVQDPNTGSDRVIAADGLHHLIAQQDELGRRWSFAYQPDSFLPIATTFPDGSVEAWALQPGTHQWTGRSDRLGRATTIARDARGLPVDVAYADGALEHDDHNALGQIVRHVDALGRETLSFYSADGDPAHAPAIWSDAANQGWLVAIRLPQDTTEASAPTWTYRWDVSAGDLASATDPSGRVFAFAYDAMHRATACTFADGSAETVAYGAPGTPDVGLVVARTDRDGRRTTFAYDASGLETARTLADGGTIARTYDRFGRLARTTSFGDAEDYAYDAAARLVAVSRHPNAATTLTTTTTYDSADRAVAVTDPYGRTAYDVYDVNDRPVRRVQELTPAAADQAGFDAAFAAGALADGPWSDAEVGAASGGSAVIAGGDATVVGGGADIWGVADAFHLLSQPSPGDGAIAARVIAQTATDPWAKAGVMIRDGLAADARYAMLAITPGHGLVFQWRSAAGEATGLQIIDATRAAPAWLRLRQDGQRVRASASGDGASWTEVASIELPLTARSRAGLAVTAHDPGALSTVAFTGVAVAKASVSPIVATAAWQAHLLGLARGADPRLVITDRSYLANGLVASTTDGRGFVTAMTYDARDRAVSRTEALGTGDAATTTTTYDAVGDVVTTTDARGIATAMTYTARDREASRRFAVGTPDEAVVRMTYTPTDHVASRTDERGLVTRYAYCACCDRIEDVIDPLGFDVHYAYDPVGNRTAVTDGNGLTTTATYDARDRMLTLTNGAGETTTYTYSDDASAVAAAAGLGFGPGADGAIIVVADALGEATAEIRDGLGRPVRRIDPLGHATTTTYDALVDDGGAVSVETAVADPLGDATRSRRDGLGRVVAVVDADGAIARMAYDADGDLVSSRDANGVGRDSTYDGRHRRVASVDTAGAATTWRYDADGDVLAETDALGATTTLTWDARGRDTSHTDRDGATTRFSYDAAGDAVAMTDAEGGTTTWVYDARGQVVAATFPPPTGGTRRFAYDGGRRETRRVDQRGVTTSYAYDGADRLIARSYSSGAAADAYAYDRAGRLVGATSGRYDDRVDRAYDAAGRLTSETLALDGVAFPVRYGYDAADRLVALTYPSGRSVARAYAPRGDLTDLAFAGSPIAHRAYDAGGRLIETDYGNGVVERRAYASGDDVIASIAAPGVASPQPVTRFDYAYDADKRVLRAADGALPDADQAFAYDPEGRPSRWQRGVAAPSTRSWDLSPVGDWRSTTIDGATQARTHTPVHEIASIDGAPVASDPMGDTAALPAPEQTFAWDDEQRMTAAAGVGPLGATAVTYRYDALGRRVQKVVDGERTTWISARAQEVVEIDGDPATAPWLAPGGDPTPPVTGVGPRGSILQLAGTLHIDFRPDAAGAEVGWLADTGDRFADHGGAAFGWDRPRPAIDRRYLAQPEWDTFVRMMPGKSVGAWSIALADGSYPVVIVMGDATSRDQTDAIVVAGATIDDPTPAQKDPHGYEQGAFDGYGVQATVVGGRLTIGPAAAASDPKICFIEIGPRGGAIDAATRDRLAHAVAAMTAATASKRVASARVRERVYGGHVDETLAIVDDGVRSFLHADRVASVAAVTDGAGAVRERYRYDAFGARDALAPDGSGPRAVALVDDGFTGRRHDDEVGLIDFRARRYSPALGRFLSRDPVGYADGPSLYAAWFVPNAVDPTGRSWHWIKHDGSDITWPLEQHDVAGMDYFSSFGAIYATDISAYAYVRAHGFTYHLFSSNEDYSAEQDLSLTFACDPDTGEISNTAATITGPSADHTVSAVVAYTYAIVGHDVKIKVEINAGANVSVTSSSGWKLGAGVKIPTGEGKPEITISGEVTGGSSLTGSGGYTRGPNSTEYTLHCRCGNRK